MQVGKEHLILAHPVILLCHRLLDLQDQVSRLPDIVGGLEYLGSGTDKVGVRDGGTSPGIRAESRPDALTLTSSCTPDGVIATGTRGS